ARAAAGYRRSGPVCSRGWGGKRPQPPGCCGALCARRAPAMRTERLAHDEAALARAAELVRGGRLVAFPTETVYGLGARADDAAAVPSLFVPHGPPPPNPLLPPL